MTIHTIHFSIKLDHPPQKEVTFNDAWEDTGISLWSLALGIFPNTNVGVKENPSTKGDLQVPKLGKVSYKVDPKKQWHKWGYNSPLMRGEITPDESHLFSILGKRFRKNSWRILFFGGLVFQSYLSREDRYSNPQNTCWSSRPFFLVSKYLQTQGVTGSFW